MRSPPSTALPQSLSSLMGLLLEYLKVKVEYARQEIDVCDLLFFVICTHMLAFLFLEAMLVSL